LAPNCSITVVVCALEGKRDIARVEKCLKADAAAGNRCMAGLLAKPEIYRAVLISLLLVVLLQIRNLQIKDGRKSIIMALVTANAGPEEG